MMLSRSILMFAVSAAFGAGVAEAQVRFEVDPATSLAWWQIDPNYGHLWATTCPDDPSWQAGEGRSPEMRIDVATRKQTSAAARSDKRIPLYPRGAVNPVCKPAVSGYITAADARTWRGLRGEIVVNPDSLITGLRLRDSYARKTVFETGKYPDMRFTIDSVTALQPGDTTRAVAHGTFEMHGSKQPMSAPVKAWSEAGGLRTQAQFYLPSKALTRQYNMSVVALGMGVVIGRWDAVHIGVDMILRPR
jgi:hypothetical protein